MSLLNMYITYSIPTGFLFVSESYAKIKEKKSYWYNVIKYVDFNLWQVIWCFSWFIYIMMV